MKIQNQISFAISKIILNALNFSVRSAISDFHFSSFFNFLLILLIWYYYYLYCLCQPVDKIEFSSDFQEPSIFKHDKVKLPCSDSFGSKCSELISHDAPICFEWNSSKYKIKSKILWCLENGEKHEFRSRMNSIQWSRTFSHWLVILFLIYLYL